MLVEYRRNASGFEAGTSIAEGSFNAVDYSRLISVCRPVPR